MAALTVQEETAVIPPQTLPGRCPLWLQEDFEDTIKKNYPLGRQLLTDFSVQTRKLLEDAQPALNLPDFTTLRRIGHMLQGSSAALSSNLLAQCASAMDTAARKGNIAETKKNYETFRNKFSDFERITETWKKTHE
jgi:HPt (histidine-containing phosphotransfer) domain-containing protein